MKIVTDSAADMPSEELESLGVTVAPLHIHFPEGEITSEQISHDDFYNRLRDMVPEIPSTSQPSSGAFSQLYSELAKSGEPIFSIHISSGLSGTLDSARAGAAQVKDADISLVDSLTLSGAERFQVIAAVLAQRAGWTRQAILERLQQIRDASELIYTLETLTYLARGGRIGRVQALAGMLLRIKPVIRVNKTDGKYDTVGKGRTLSKSLEIIVEHLFSLYGAQTPLWVTVMHGQFKEQADELARLISDKMQVARLEILRVSPVLGVHVGPGIVGAAVVPISLMEGF